MKLDLLYKHPEEVASMVLSLLKACELKKLSLQELQLLELSLFLLYSCISVQNSIGFTLKVPKWGFRINATKEPFYVQQRTCQ